MVIGGDTAGERGPAAGVVWKKREVGLWEEKKSAKFLDGIFGGVGEERRRLPN
jgi:hypothetical protein